MRLRPLILPAAAFQQLHAEREGVRHAGVSMLIPERRYGAGLVEPDPGVQLLRKAHLGVMAAKLGFRPVDHADESLEARLHEATSSSAVVAEVQQEAPDAGLMAEPFIAVG